MRYGNSLGVRLFELGEQIQSGIASGANEHFRFARFEGALTQWHQRLEERLARA